MTKPSLEEFYCSIDGSLLNRTLAGVEGQIDIAHDIIQAAKVNTMPRWPSFRSRGDYIGFAIIVFQDASDRVVSYRKEHGIFGRRSPESDDITDLKPDPQLRNDIFALIENPLFTPRPSSRSKLK